MAKAKYKQNSRGAWEKKIWDGTYNADGSKHRKRLVSRKSSAYLEKQVNKLKNEVENGKFVQNTDIMFLDYAKHWLQMKKGVREMNTQKMYQNIIEKHLSFLSDVRLCDIRNSQIKQRVPHSTNPGNHCKIFKILYFKFARNESVYLWQRIHDYTFRLCKDVGIHRT